MLEAREINPIRFRSQLDPTLHTLVADETGINAAELELCWVACIDMAFSAFIADPISRELALRTALREVADKDVIRQDGQFNIIGGNQQLTLAVRKAITPHNPNISVGWIDEPRFDDFHKSLDGDRVLIFGLGREGSGHVMLIDALFRKKDEIVYGYYDPAKRNELEARKFINQYQLYYMHNHTDLKLLPFLMTFGYNSSQ